MMGALLLYGGENNFRMYKFLKGRWYVYGVFLVNVLLFEGGEN